jgi:hypothetical protein
MSKQAYESYDEALFLNDNGEWPMLDPIAADDDPDVVLSVAIGMDPDPELIHTDSDELTPDNLIGNHRRRNWVEDRVPAKRQR